MFYVFANMKYLFKSISYTVKFVLRFLFIIQQVDFYKTPPPFPLQSNQFSLKKPYFNSISKRLLSVGLNILRRRLGNGVTCVTTDLLFY